MLFRHTVISNKKLNAKFNSIKLRSKSKDFLFRVGQFVAVRADKNIFRLYSIASEPQDLPYWNIFVDITPGGPGTSYLKSLKKGQVVETLSPKGQFILSNKMNNYIFGATGCGIAPFIPMITELLKNKEKKVSLIWGLRFKKDIALTKMLNSLRKIHSNFSYEIILSKPETSWHGKRGHVTLPILEKVKESDSTKTGIYLSGSREFIKEATVVLDKEKFPLKKIYFEACY
jgi:ferredoxin-NADP reductase